MTNWPKYFLIQRILHWSIATLVVITLGIGATLGTLGFNHAVDLFGMATTNTLYVVHKTVGVLMIGLMIVRITARLALGKPAYAVALAPVQKFASETVHGLFYALLIIMPLIGWAATDAGGYPINFFHWVLPSIVEKDSGFAEVLFQWHAIIGWLLMGLVLVHISGALYHWLIRRDGVMQRMWPGA
ncbi:MAG: cytochrome b [Spiribacter sp.]|jgi:cytochrome b561|nr:cytochrome b [Spiribacter sp.]MDR9489761.1 cytochrome b [Spiribacter sp.]